jgi:hypothetical protein
MMVVVVKVMLSDTGSRWSSGGIAGNRLAGNAARGTKASARRQRKPASRADAARRFRLTIRSHVVRGRVSRHAMNRFLRRCHGLRIRLRPAKVARQPLKKLVNLLAFDELILFWIGRIRLVFGHGNLIADIVGEFAR